MENDANERAVAGILRETITDEIFAAFGLPSRGWQRRIFGPVFWLPAQIFGRIMAGVDRTVGEQGVPEAARRLLKYFVDDIQVCGKENIPSEGPVLIASNHPGAYDSVAILSCLPRKDIKAVVSDVPVLRSMPAASQLMVYAIPGTQGRMTAVRGVMRQMQQGGALMIFPSGLVDSDPDVLPGAEKELESWSRSLDLVMRKVPETKIIVTIASGVLSPICLRNPLTRLPKKEWEQRKLAEFLQVIQQLALKRKFGLKPRLTFDIPLTGVELLAQSGSTDLHQAILWRARQVLQAHMETAPGAG
jgi:hypothetical protein